MSRWRCLLLCLLWCATLFHFHTWIINKMRFYSVVKSLRHSPLYCQTCIFPCPGILQCDSSKSSYKHIIIRTLIPPQSQRMSKSYVFALLMKISPIFSNIVLSNYTCIFKLMSWVIGYELKVYICIFDLCLYKVSRMRHDDESMDSMVPAFFGFSENLVICCSCAL